MALAVIAAMAAGTACSGDDDTPAEAQPTAAAGEAGSTGGNTGGNGSGAPQDSTGEQNGGHVVYMLPRTRAITLTAEQRQLAVQGNTFSAALFRAVSGKSEFRGRSLALSPVSVAYLLGMLSDGAAGTTQAELLSLLGLPADGRSLLDGYCRSLMEQAPLADPSVTLSTANIVAAAEGMALSQQFTADIGSHYQAEAVTLDFTKPAAALDYLNGWCRDKTQGMIPRILDHLDPATLLVAMNAVYFRAPWTAPFDPEATREATFTAEDGQTAVVPMMHARAVALYAPGETYTTLCLPYGSGTAWEMLVMLPAEGRSVADVAEALCSTPWEQQWAAGRRRCEVDVRLPRFSTSSEITLSDIVSQMGAPLMFTPGADFTPMTAAGERLSVSTLYQRAAIDVSEEGTKAAAVTVTTMEGALAPVQLPAVDFHADRPFVYVIREVSTGVVFFIGTCQ